MVPFVQEGSDELRAPPDQLAPARRSRKHLIQCGLVEILEVADFRPFRVEKRCHLAILLQVGNGKAPVLSPQVTAIYQITGNAFQT